MSTLLQRKPEHSPTLNTVIMVERVLQNMDKSVFSLAEVKRKLPKQVNHNALKVILRYLEASNKIAVTIDGITWIHNQNVKLRGAVQKGLEL